jgi:hypothetical protein
MYSNGLPVLLRLASSPVLDSESDQDPPEVRAMQARCYASLLGRYIDTEQQR